MGYGAFDPGSCCDEDCDIGLDDFADEGFTPDWEVESGDWSQSLGALTGEGAGRIIYQIHAALTDPYTIDVELTAIAGSPAAARVLVAYADADNYLFCEIRTNDECAELQLGQRAGGDEAWLADAVPLYANHDELDEAIQLRVCYQPQEDGSALLQAITGLSYSSFDFDLDGPSGLAYSVATVPAPEPPLIEDEEDDPLTDEDDEEIEDEEATDAPEFLLSGLEIVTGDWEARDWQLRYHYTAERPACVTCSPSCPVMRDNFVRDTDGDPLGCHWEEVESGWTAVEGTCNGTTVWYAETDDDGMAIARHEATTPENSQFVVASPYSELTDEGPGFPACRPVEDLRYRLIFGYTDDTDYYAAEFWYTEETGGAQWHCRLLHVGSELAAADGFIGGDRYVGFHVCYRDGWAILVAGDEIGLRHPLTGVTGRRAGIGGEGGAALSDFRFYQEPVSTPPGANPCIDCTPYVPPCAGCSGETVEILMGTLAGVVGNSGADASALNTNYLTQALGSVSGSPTCCYWVQTGCPTLAGRLGPSCSTNPPPAGWQTCSLTYGAVTFTAAAAVTSIWIAGTTVWGMVVIYDTHAGTGYAQVGLFTGTLPATPTDCTDIDITLTPLNGTGTPYYTGTVDFCGVTVTYVHGGVDDPFGGTPARRGVNFMGATLRVRTASL